MPNGYHGSREGWVELEAPFVAADEIFERFAREHDVRFDMGASASFDRDRKRYFRTEPLKDGVDWLEIVEHLDELLQRGFELACSWGENDIPFVLDLPQL
jgi:hypothetical protein